MNRALLLVIAAALAALVAACAPLVDEPTGFPAMPVPADNPLTREKIDLGRALFYDGRLSKTGDVSCASCHVQENAFAEPRAVSEGVFGRIGPRNAPPLFNLAWNTSFFWDGGADTMEKQVLGPILNPQEMDSKIEDVVQKLAADPTMVASFRRAFGTGPSAEGITKAIASFERTIVSADSRFDRGELTELEQRGHDLFFSERAECFHCHGGFDFSNHQIMNNGMNTGDEGRSLVTEDPLDHGKFKVPSLRNVAYTAPYMHDGSLATLADVIDHYRAGGQGHPNTDPTIHALDIDDDEAAALVAFLQALSDPGLLRDPRFAR